MLARITLQRTTEALIRICRLLPDALIVQCRSHHSTASVYYVLTVETRGASLEAVRADPDVLRVQEVAGGQGSLTRTSL